MPIPVRNPASATRHLVVISLPPAIAVSLAAGPTVAAAGLWSRTLVGVPAMLGPACSSTLVAVGGPRPCGATPRRARHANLSGRDPMRSPLPDGARSGAAADPGRSCGHGLGVEREGQHGLGDRRRDASRSSTRSPSGQRPRGVVFSPDYAKLYICASDDDTVQVLDVATRKIVADLPSGADPEFFDLAPGRAASLHRQRGRRDHHRGRHGEPAGRGADRCRRRARGHGDQP